MLELYFRKTNVVAVYRRGEEGKWRVQDRGLQRQAMN